MTDRDAFLAGILANPDADLPRLVYADWLDEHGEPERAEFIRVQIEKSRLIAAKACPAYAAGRCCRSMACPLCPLHRRETDLCFMGRGLPGWFPPVEFETYHLAGAEPPAGPAGTVRRGFVEVVCGPLAWLIGGECEACEGSGNRWGNGSALGGPCPTCHGTGTTPGRMRDIVRTHPVTEVVVSNRPPAFNAAWPCWSFTFAATRPDESLPDELYDLMADAPGCTHRSHTWLGYATEAAARADLSAAILSKAKEFPT